MIDQLTRLLGLINSFRVEKFEGRVNPTSGARLNFDTQLKAFHLTAADGADPGIVVSFEGMGINHLSLPSKDRPALAFDPYIENLSIDLDERFFARAADFLNEPTLASMHQVINRVQIGQLLLKVRIDGQKIVHLDAALDAITFQHDSEVLISAEDLSLSVLDYDSKKPPAVAQKEATVVLRTLRFKLAQALFSQAITAARLKIPRELNRIKIELPGPLMVVDGAYKKGLSISFRVDLRLETENNFLGIFFDRFYVPGTNLKLPGPARNILLGLIRTLAEKRLGGLVEVSNESLRIDPWSRVPFRLHKKVKSFAVEQGCILLEFEPPIGAPKSAAEHALGPDSDAVEVGTSVLPPGPALL